MFTLFLFLMALDLIVVGIVAVRVRHRVQQSRMDNALRDLLAPYAVAAR